MPRRTNKFESAGARRAKALGQFVEEVRRDKLLRNYKGLCGICGRPVNPKKFEIDHILPLSKGGEHRYSNCQPSHPACNRLKADLLPHELSEVRKRIKNRYNNNNVESRKKATRLAATKNSKRPNKIGKRKRKLVSKRAWSSNNPN